MQTALGPLSPQLRITCALTLFLPLRFEWQRPPRFE
jgi:hypothetical protein